MKMKKTYKAPVSKVAVLDGEFVCTMDSCSIKDGNAKEGEDLAKERHYIDFSDDESIW